MEAPWLASQLEAGRSIESIARETGRSPSTVAYWVNKHGLRTRPRRYALRGEDKPATLVRECPLHGWTTYVRIGGRRYRCGKCNVESVAARRRRIKEILVREAGGRCLICGFAKFIGALHFHHVDPASKAFSVSRDGVTRSLRRAREEAGKCVLLCANCHAMVEAGLLDLAAPADHPG
jgi:transposase-like protein